MRPLFRRPAFRVTLSRPRALLAAAGVIVGVILFSGGAAFAYFLATDSSNPAPAGYTPTGYTVLRCVGSSCSSPANFTAVSNGTCGTAALSTSTATSCTDTDTALAAGTSYSYEVEALDNNWVSTPSIAWPTATTAAAKLAFTTQPTSVQAKGTGSFPVTVEIRDSNGNKITNDSTDQVTLTITNGTGTIGATLSCTNTGGLTVTASSGVATFNGCAIDKAGTGYTLTATSGSLTQATSNSFNVTAGAAAKITVVSGDSQSANVSTAFTSPLVAAVTDANGNPVSGVAVTFSAPSSNASAAFGSCSSNPQTYSCVASTGANGQVTSSTFTANSMAGGYSIVASAAGATGVGQIDASKVCSAWTNGSSGIQAVSSSNSVITIAGGNNTNNTLSFTTAPSDCGTFNFGTIDLGDVYFNPSGNSDNQLTFTGSTIAYDGSAHTLTITLGTGSFNGSSKNLETVPKSVLTLNLSGNIVGTSENAITGNPFKTASVQQF